MGRAATPAAERERRQKIAAALRGRPPVAAIQAARAPEVVAERAASLRVYWANATEKLAELREWKGRRMAALREARKADRIDRQFADALRAIKAAR